MKYGSITTGIIADGLVFNMDPANRASYPRTGTTVKDTVGNINGTLSTAEMFNVQSIKTFIFDGVDSDILSSTNGPNLSRVSLSAWFKRNGDQNNYNGVFGIRNAGGAPHYGISWDIAFQSSPSNTQKIQWRVSNGSDAYKLINSNSAISDNTWTNIIGTMDGTSVLMYINGVLQTETETFSGTLLAPSKPINIGKQANTDNHYFKGDIGPCHIYNRALSATEVMKNFNALKDRMGYVAPITVTFLVVAGGGGSMGGYVRGVGGGGAGGLRTSFGSTSGGGASAESNITALPGTSYTVTIGAGGAGPANATNAFNLGNSGNSSVFASITSIGGGRGGSGNNGNGSTGGSAGGHGGTSNNIPTSGTTGQGTAGGTNNNSGIGAGGGGASTAGTAGASGGTGGNGLAVSVTGTSVTYAGGGGGGANAGTGGTGGTGGGGNGGTKSTQTAGVDGSINTGGGAGGAVNIPLGFNGGYGPGHSGGSGVVILRYSSDYTITSGAGLTSSTTTSGGDKITIFTAGTDTITFS